MNQRQADLLAAAERFVVLARQAQDASVQVPPETIAMCLRAYDAAKQRTIEPSGFDHVLKETSLTTSEKKPDPESPYIQKIDALSEPIPEAATISLIHAKSEWERTLIEARVAVDALSREYEKNGLDPVNEPCPSDLAILYKRCFRAQDIVNTLSMLINRVLAGHAHKLGESPAWVFCARVNKTTMEQAEQNQRTDGET